MATTREPLALIGDVSVGKTSFLLLFNKFFRLIGTIEGGKLGSTATGETSTMDFLNFSYNGQIYTLYGTGGHRTNITDYYRKKVINRSANFILIIDASRPLDEQIRFLQDIGFTNRRVVICLNKVDIVPREKIPEIKEKLLSALKQVNITPIKIFNTVTVEKKSFEEENKNVLNAVLEYIKHFA